MTRILGVDPGSRITGYGLVEGASPRSRCVAFGTVRPVGVETLADRLLFIHRGLVERIQADRPEIVAVETAFYSKSARSALVLGHVRGVVLLAARQAGIPVVELAPREIKRSVTGNGNAAKDQVAFMVRGLLGLTEIPPPDAADALAAALCCWHQQRPGTRIPTGAGR